MNANRVLTSKVGLRPGERVLDAGCGAGGSAVWLARELGARVVGVNLSPGQIHRAPARPHAGCLRPDLLRAPGLYRHNLSQRVF